ncbi:phosphotransferase family protein [Pseudalkalibacillus hwajinpoensis]|uniref:phosphotransferase family protein n=1 Tax=Guptibacillus hwajinpoensis TaxID=208199 RepID=UPI001CD64C03|nr:aminoglycoside phosphotransferase family protein [Pseudalkalibacillus hwajinpoensis]
MKTNWERHQAIIHLPDEAITSIVKSYHPHWNITSTTYLSGGLSHTNLKVDIANEKPIVIRVARNAESLYREKEIHGILPTRVRKPYFLHLTKWNGYNIGLLEWMEGELLRDQLTISSALEIGEMGKSIGEQLACIRKKRFTTYGFLDPNLNVREEFRLTPQSFITTIESFFKHHASKWLPEHMPEKIIEYAKENAPLLKEDQSGARLVHGDFNGLNILMTGTEVSAILDWEFALSGSIYFDIGNLLRYEFNHIDSFEQGLYKGLKNKGISLPKQWKKLAKLADLVALCSLLDRVMCGENRVKDITCLIKQTIHSE